MSRNLTEEATTDDLIQPFQIDGAAVRGHVVRLGPAAAEMLGRHTYPEAVSRLLGEAVALTALLTSTLKFEGIFTLQIQAAGPVTLMVVDCRSNGDLRAMASYKAEAFAAPTDAIDDRAAAELLGKGHLAFTVDQGPDTERYQGIVELDGPTLADCAQAYFRRSEQLATAISLAAGRGADGTWRLGGIMVQRLPGEGPLLEVVDEAVEAWQRNMVLMKSVKPAELLDAALPPRDLLYRLFHEDGVWIHPTRPLRAKCRCSRARVAGVLKSFPAEEVADLVEDGWINVTCEFCNETYKFEPGDYGS